MRNLQTLLKELTLKEKASLLSGKTFWTTRDIERLGIHSVKMTDGPHGLREETSAGGITSILNKTVPATCFPSLVAYASSFDRELAYECSKAIGKEAAARGIVTVLGPSVNIKRSSLCGRNFEYFSEDPYLSSEMTTAFAKGLKSENIGCSLKHYCANNQETDRMIVDSIVDQRTLREIYLPSFEKAVKEVKPMQVMCSYNRLNGEYTSESKKFLTDILRGEWGFDGMVVSDWGAVNDRVKSIKAGLDLEMPGNNEMNSRKIIAAYEQGEITMDEIDEAVKNVLCYVERGIAWQRPEFTYDCRESHKIARKMAAAGTVLLKNKTKLLPFDKSEKITVIGALAETPRYQGTGSSHMNPIELVSILDAMKKEDIDYRYLPGYKLSGDGYDETLFNDALRAAKVSDKIMLVIGLTNDLESEGFDRKSLSLPEIHNRLVEEISAINSNVAVVLVCGSAVEMPWIDKVSSVMNISVGGEAAGEGAVDVLFGDVNPSGRLPETYPLDIKDNINTQYFPMGSTNVQYRESVYVGYRYFDTAGKDVLFPFGHGLSYTDFEYSNIKLSSSKIKDTDTLTVSFDIKNIGSVPGAEVAQIYVKDIESTIYRPEKELKEFRKVYLEPGEKKTVKVTLNKRAFAFYNVLVNDWTVESGDFEIMVGASSRDIRLSSVVKIAAPAVKIKDYRKTAPVYYNLREADSVPLEQFEAIYGTEVPENIPPHCGTFDVNNSLNEIAVVPLGKLLRTVVLTVSKILSKGSDNEKMANLSVVMFPMRYFSGLTAGLITSESVEGFTDMLNKKKGGFTKTVKGLCVKRKVK